MTDEISPGEKQLKALTKDYQARAENLQKTNLSMYEGLGTLAGKLKEGAVDRNEATDIVTNPIFDIYKTSRDIKAGEDGKGGGNAEFKNDLNIMYGVDSRNIEAAMQGMATGNATEAIGGLEQTIGKNAGEIFLRSLGQNISGEDAVGMVNELKGFKDYVNTDGLKITGINSQIAQNLVLSYAKQQQGVELGAEDALNTFAKAPYALNDKGVSYLTKK